jgi:N-acetylmuramoyl-L-alanine amidase CwlA
MTPQEFINKIAPIFQKYAKQYGYKIASAAIAQACLESGYGTSYKAIHGNNILGLKYRPNRITTNNGYFENGGTEQNPDGTYTQLPSNTAWYAFDDYDHCIEGYYQFLRLARYAAVKEAGDPLTYLQAIKDAGYATSLNYVDNVYNVVQKYNLTQYDNFEQVPIQQQTSVPAFQIIQKTSTHNTTKCNNRKIEWIVLHYTAGTTSTRGSAQNTASYFSRTTNQASADFIVDDETAVQYNPDPKNYYCWAVGGNKYSNKVTSLSGLYYGQCKNNNSISIEMCSNKINKASLTVTDNDWYITENTKKMAIQLTKYLMQLYNIDKNHIIMHHHVTGKICPQPWCKNEQALNEWNNFLAAVSGSQSQTSVSVVPSIPAQDTISGGKQVRYTVRITAKTLNVRSGPGTIYSINRTVSKGSIYTIIEEQGNWGRLLSGAGWICLDYTEKTEVVQQQSSNKLPYLVRITADSLNVRKGPGTNYDIVRTVSRPSIYTIVEESGKWGRLKSGVGWIHLDYTEKV